MLNHIYRNMMRQHPYGYALYQPESSLIVKPGALGYINNEGRWTPLVGSDGKNVDLSVPETLINNGLTAFNKFHPAPQETMSWGPKVSDQVKGNKVDFIADVSLLPAGIPADVGALFRFKTDAAFGAILMTANPVTREAVYGTKDYLAWCKENAAVIVRSWPDVEDHGVVIVTSIHKTTRADLKSWQDKNKEFAIGFKASAVGIGEVAPASEWYKASSDDGWIMSSVPQDSSEQRVVFFGGLYWKFNKLSRFLSGSSTLKVSDVYKLRSGQQSNSFTESYQEIYNGEQYDVSCETIGDFGLETPEEQGEENEEDPDMEY